MVFLWELARSRLESVVRSETLNFWEGVMPPCLGWSAPRPRAKRKNVIKRRMPSRAHFINIAVMGTGNALEGPIIYLSWFSVRFMPFRRARPHTVPSLSASAAQPKCRAVPTLPMSASHRRRAWAPGGARRRAAGGKGDGNRAALIGRLEQIVSSSTAQDASFSIISTRARARFQASRRRGSTFNCQLESES